MTGFKINLVKSAISIVTPVKLLSNYFSDQNTQTLFLILPHENTLWLSYVQKELITSPDSADKKHNLNLYQASQIPGAPIDFSLVNDNCYTVRAYILPKNFKDYKIFGVNFLL